MAGLTWCHPASLTRCKAFPISRTQERVWEDLGAHTNCGDQWWVAFLRGRYGDQRCLTPLSATCTVGLSAPSASLPMTPSCVMQLTGGKGCHPQGPWQTGDVGPCEPHEVQQAKRKVLHTGLGNPKHKHRLGREWTATESNLEEKVLGMLVDEPTISWAAPKEAWPAGQGRWLWPSTLLWWNPTWSPASSSGPPAQERLGPGGAGPEESHKNG